MAKPASTIGVDLRPGWDMVADRWPPMVVDRAARSLLAWQRLSTGRDLALTLPQAVGGEHDLVAVCERAYRMSNIPPILVAPASAGLKTRDGADSAIDLTLAKMLASSVLAQANGELGTGEARYRMLFKAMDRIGIDLTTNKERT